MPLSPDEIIADLFTEAKLVPGAIAAIKAYTATPKADRKYAGLCSVLGVDPAGFIGLQLSMIDTLEDQSAS